MHHDLRALGVCALVSSFAVVVLVLPAAARAQLSPGCRAATAADHAQMEARGLPKAYQVCSGDTKYAGIGQNFERWYAQLKSTSPCNRNACTLPCRTRNTGAMICSAVSRKWNSIGCHPNNNTAIFPTVSHGFAAHIELLRRYCGRQGRCTIASVTSKWATANQARYASFVSRHSGIPYNQVFNPNDIDTVARIALTMSCFEAGSLPYSIAELKQGLLMASGGPRLPVPANVGQLLQESLNQPYSPAQPVAPVQPFFGPQGPGASAAQDTSSLPPPAPPPRTASIPLGLPMLLPLAPASSSAAARYMADQPAPISSLLGNALNQSLASSNLKDEINRATTSATEKLDEISSSAKDVGVSVLSGVGEPIERLSDTVGSSTERLATEIRRAATSSVARATSSPFVRRADTFTPTYEDTMPPTARTDDSRFFRPFLDRIETIIRGLLLQIERL